ncbi:MobF family relaxase [Mycolicibacterium sp. YH-1]|uniref:MobF family relaxase n=1 Tax=Mycolicibacterium sp. YH-1 TaxID=2908837 RepID=UPI001F4BFBD9|nr:MobF family relaxase [Mycolicibacterium sp. YH-1]UNB50919.1 relaxase domain-containing protein [Mycolicibacterium sp. YH-1]
MLTISKLKQWSINYYIDTADTAARASRDACSAGGGLGEYYSEHDTPHPGLDHRWEQPDCCEPAHLHTHVIVPNRQTRADGRLVSLDGTSLYHEAKAAGVIYQATLRRELNRSLGFEWEHGDPNTGMAELAGMSRDTIAAWSRRSSQLRDWAAGHFNLREDGSWSAAQLGAAQKATRPTKPEELAWSALVEQWRADPRGMTIDRPRFLEARDAPR